MVKRGRVVVGKESPLMVRKDIATPAVVPSVTQGKTGENIAKVFQILFNLSIMQLI